MSQLKRMTSVKMLLSPLSARLFSSSAVARTRFVQYTCSNDGPQRLGVQLAQDGDIIELSAVNAAIPNNLVDFIRDASIYTEKAKRVIAEGKSVVRLEEVKLLPPIMRPDKVICVGLNYKSHCDEQKKPYPEEPFFFNKFPSTIVGPFDDVIHPPNSRALDWEVELAVVIGKKCRAVKIHESNDYIFGYTICQDISARDWQTQKKNNGQWLFAKSMDTFCPLGPSVVSKEVVANPNKLQLSCSVNGLKMQDGNTEDMVHDINRIVSYLSECVTLLPGDVILTGTPSGVGVFQNPRMFLKPGDIVESEISGIGKMCNKIISFPRKES
ncbi:fumarylacetoacetate hydrolase domain-containing protein 2 [Cimex lectularius]|uniref:Fumarylacetoacetase-like C-terminal domain-containing protein n=1 Tax=Cimex lectularius TaxID=79782 RepID=A0A8I6SAL3_CIMLE|nr:fumarylacetoacetate hydrolase domain-containing protein 2 [Cimex lectularius]